MKKKPAKWKCDLSKCWVDWVDFGIGVWGYVCRSREAVAPIGILWGIPYASGVFYILHCHVPKWAQRNGVMTFIHDHVRKQYPTLMTGEGSAEGGLKFIQAYGYRKDKKFGWAVTK